MSHSNPQNTARGLQKDTKNKTQIMKLNTAYVFYTMKKQTWISVGTFSHIWLTWPVNPDHWSPPAPRWKEGPSGCENREAIVFSNVSAINFGLGLLLFLSIHLSWGFWLDVCFQWSVISYLGAPGRTKSPSTVARLGTWGAPWNSSKFNVKYKPEIFTKGRFWSHGWTLNLSKK